VFETAPLAGERLSDHTTIRLGGPAGSFVRAATEADLVEVIADADAAGTPVLVLGGGSNLIVADAGFSGMVVQVDHRGVVFQKGDASATLQVCAGEPWDDVVLASLAEGLGGLESLSGIPGRTGATPIQNVGAYGAEISDVVIGVRVLDRADHTVRQLAPPQCAFGYRASALKGQQRFVVLSIELALRHTAVSAPIRYSQLADALGVEPGSSAPTADVRSAVLELRASKGMLIDEGARDPDSVSAGSFFTNPVLEIGALPAGAPSWPAADGQVKTSAAWLIEQAGFGRGYGHGAVGLSSKHTLALVNRGRASTVELLELAREIRAGVHAAFGVVLEAEPVFVGVAL
jgi:UDP-N-acetylmuramate dehydrogenase